MSQMKVELSGFKCDGTIAICFQYNVIIRSTAKQKCSKIQ